MDYINDFSSRFKYALKLRNKKAVDVCRVTGLSSALISQYLTGKFEPKNDKAVIIANYLNVSPAWLLGWTDDDKGSDEANVIRKIPLYELISCGKGGFVDDNIIDYVSLPAEMFNKHKEYFAQYAHGDSMINANIHEGDLVIFEKCSDFVNGMIGCFCIDENKATCKRLSITDGQIILLPENPSYVPILVPIEAFKCVGKLAFVVNDRREEKDK